MEPGLLSYLSKKIAATFIALGSMFYSTIDGVSAEFDAIEITTHGASMEITTRLENCFTEELEQIFRSGKEIRFNFRVEVIDQSQDTITLVKDYFHAIRFSLIDRVYSVYLSESQTQFNALNLKEAKRKLTLIDELAIDIEHKLRKQEYYRLRLTAWLDKIQLQGMEEPLNLMFYWNSIKPERYSRLFTSEIFRK
ncbi:MAG: DUF4390 domain-containing protein [Fidelibacterota bacterium]